MIPDANMEDENKTDLNGNMLKPLREAGQEKLLQRMMMLTKY